MKITQIRESKRLFGACYRAKESAIITCTWHRLKSRQNRKASQWGKKESLQVCSDWRHSAWRSWRWATRSQVSYVIGKGCIFSSLWLVLSWKWRQILGKLPVNNQAQVILFQLLQGLLLASWTGCWTWSSHFPQVWLIDSRMTSWASCWRLEVFKSSVFIYGLAIVYIFSFSKDSVKSLFFLSFLFPDL